MPHEPTLCHCRSVAHAPVVTLRQPGTPGGGASNATTLAEVAQKVAGPAPPSSPRLRRTSRSRGRRSEPLRPICARTLVALGRASEGVLGLAARPGQRWLQSTPVDANRPQSTRVAVGSARAAARADVTSVPTGRRSAPPCGAAARRSSWPRQGRTSRRNSRAQDGYHLLDLRFPQASGVTSPPRVTSSMSS